MDMETQELLKRTLTLAEENNKLLKKMEVQAKWSMYYYILKWVLFIAFTAGAYYYVRPYFDELLKIYQQLNEGVNIIFKNGSVR